MSNPNKKVLIIGLIFAGLLCLGCGYAKFMFVNGMVKEMQTKASAAENQVVELKDKLVKLQALEDRREEIQDMLAKLAEQCMVQPKP